MSFKLYYSPGTCAFAVHVALIWAEADYSLEVVTLGSEEYKKINPLGSVPALLYKDKIMTESISLLNLISNLYPNKNMLGKTDPINKQLTDQWLSFLVSDVHSTYSRLFYPAKFTSIKNDKKVLDSIREAADFELNNLYTIIDKHLSENKFMINNSLSLLDIYLYTTTTWMPMVSKFNIDKYINIKKLCEIVEKNEGVLKAKKEQGL